ncbi:MAG: undecaprenyldiphospho-muramoylpentapeptide beta-N-acetylglucosaminyltransferase [Acidiferrobacterales bacterium]
MVMAGGTGGHVFPGLAVAEYLRSQGVGVVWMGTRTGLEARAVPVAGFEIDWVSIRGLRRGGLLGWLLLPIRLSIAMAQSVRTILRRRPDAVLAMGGFVAGPGGFVAWFLRRPLLVHEQNAIAGLANRLLALVADHVLCGFPDAFRNLPTARHVGNPVRREIRALTTPKHEARDRGPLRVLVLGGSQGAQIFNTVLPEALRSLAAAERPKVWHQCGEQWLGSTQAAYKDAVGDVRVTGFIDDMAEAYRWADLVICRGGAMTISELCVAGRPAVLVPYPFAVDDHQTANARFLADREAAILVAQDEFVGPRVRELLMQFAANRELLGKMAMNAHRCAMPDAAELVGQLCMEAMRA